jgi:hypothetical protein
MTCFHTRRLRTAAGLAAGFLAMLTTSAWAKPPAVVETEPPTGSESVDPNTRFIRVKFDQDMVEGSHSWCGGGVTFPKLRGVPYWESPRVAVLAVELEPLHEYAININCPSARNFHNARGEAVTPYGLTFKTGPRRAPLDMRKVITEENKASVPLLRRVIDNHYAYRDLRRVDWDRVFKQHGKQLADAPSTRAFAERAAKLLAQAKDIHLTVKVDDVLLATHRRAVPPNCDVKTLRRLVPNWKKLSPRVVCGRWEDDIGYLLIATWERSHAEALEAVYVALDELSDTKALIVDVRLNAGGDERLAAAFAGCFADRPRVYAKHMYRVPQMPDGFNGPFERTLQPTRGRPAYRGKVAVLMGRHNMSSAEAFLLMMRAVPGCVLVGEASYGSSGNPQPHGLPNGVIVNVPSWKALTAEGQVFEGKGLKPEVEVKAVAGSHTPRRTCTRRRIRERRRARQRAKRSRPRARPLPAGTRGPAGGNRPSPLRRHSSAAMSRP